MHDTIKGLQKHAQQRSRTHTEAPPILSKEALTNEAEMIIEQRKAAWQQEQPETAKQLTKHSTYR